MKRLLNMQLTLLLLLSTMVFGAIEGGTSCSEASSIAINQDVTLRLTHDDSWNGHPQKYGYYAFSVPNNTEATITFTAPDDGGAWLGLSAACDTDTIADQWTARNTTGTITETLQAGKYHFYINKSGSTVKDIGFRVTLSDDTIEGGTSCSEASSIAINQDVTLRLTHNDSWNGHPQKYGYYAFSVPNNTEATITFTAPDDGGAWLGLSAACDTDTIADQWTARNTTGTITETLQAGKYHFYINKSGSTVKDIGFRVTLSDDTIEGGTSCSEASSIAINQDVTLRLTHDDSWNSHPQKYGYYAFSVPNNTEATITFTAPDDGGAWLGLSAACDTDTIADQWTARNTTGTITETLQAGKYHFYINKSGSTVKDIGFSVVGNYKKYPEDTTFDKKTIADVTKPNYLGSYIDPIFGNKVTRITNRAEQNASAHNYPKTQSWNAGMSLIRLGYRLYNADTFSESILTVNEHLRGSLAEMKWSSTDADTFYGIDIKNDRFVFTKATINWESSTISYANMTNATFMRSEYDEFLLGKYEGNLDYQDNYVVFAGRKKDTNRVTLIVYNLKNNEIVATKTTDLKWYKEDENGNFTIDSNETNESSESNQMFDWASVSALGNYVIVDYASHDGDEGEKYTIEKYNINLDYIGRLANHGEHGDLGIDTNGKEVYVQFGFGSYKGIWMYPLDGSPPVKLLPNKYNGGHISCRNYQRPGWCYLNTYEIEEDGKGWREVFALKLDGSQTVERFAQTHNSDENSDDVQVNVSPDGKQLLFASDWNDTSNTIDTYHVKVGE